MRAGRVMVALGAIVAGCGSSAGSASPDSSRAPAVTAQPAEPGYRLYVMPDTWGTLGLGHTYSEVWPVISELDLDTALVVIAEEDIVRYDWADQLLTLTADAAERLGAVPTKLMLELAENCFVVALDGNRLYGGIFMLDAPELARAIEFPVIRRSSEGGQVGLRIRPSRGVEPAPNSLIDIAAIRERFAALGKLASPAPPSSAATEPHGNRGLREMSRVHLIPGEPSAARLQAHCSPRVGRLLTILAVRPGPLGRCSLAEGG